MKCNYSKKFVRKRIKLFADDDESTGNKIAENILMPAAGLAALGGIGYAGYKGITGIGKGIGKGANFLSGYYTNKKTGMNSADAFRNAKEKGQEGLIQNYLDRREINKQQQTSANANNKTNNISEKIKEAVTTPNEETKEMIAEAEAKAKQQLSGNNNSNTNGQVSSEANEILNKAKENNNNNNNNNNGTTGGNTNGQQSATELANKSKQHSQFRSGPITEEEKKARIAAGADKRAERENARRNSGIDPLEERLRRKNNALQITVDNPDVLHNKSVDDFTKEQIKNTFDPNMVKKVKVARQERRDANAARQQQEHEAAVARKQQRREQRAIDRQNAYKQNVKLKNSEQAKQIRAQRKTAAKENINQLERKEELLQNSPEKFVKSRQTAAKKGKKLLNTTDISTLPEDQRKVVTSFRDVRNLAARKQQQQQAQQQKQLRIEQQKQQQQQQKQQRIEQQKQQGQQVTQFRRKKRELLSNPVVQQSPEAMNDVMQGKFRKANGVIKNQQNIENRRQRSQHYIHIYTPEQIELLSSRVRSGNSYNRNFDSYAPENKVPRVLTAKDRSRLAEMRESSKRAVNLSRIKNDNDNFIYTHSRPKPPTVTRELPEAPLTTNNANSAVQPQQSATEMANKSKQHSQFKPKSTQNVTGIVPKKPVVMLTR